MSIRTHPLAGPIFMVLATGSYVMNDTLMKVATDSLPPYQVLTMRGIAALIWGLPLLFILGYGGRLKMMFDGTVLVRNICEMAAVLCFMLALANMPIADAMAFGQVTPLIVLVGASLLLREQLSRIAILLIGVGFLGALMVAQPSGQGISRYVVLALAFAVLSAMRDLTGRRVAAAVPAMIVAISAVLIVLAGAAGAHLLLEDWIVPEPRHLLLLGGSGLFLIFGHFCIFTAYRIGPTSAVAPFFYCFALWAVVSGLVVFGELPNIVALAGILLIVVSGLAIVLLERRKRRLSPVA